MFIYSRFEELRKEKGITKTYIGYQLGRSHSLCQSWKEGKAEPNLDQLRFVADLLGTTTEYLTGESDEKQKPATNGDGHINMSEQQKEALSLIAQLTDQEVSIVLSQLKGILQDRSAPGAPKE